MHVDRVRNSLKTVFCMWKRRNNKEIRWKDRIQERPEFLRRYQVCKVNQSRVEIRVF